MMNWRHFFPPISGAVVVIAILAIEMGAVLFAYGNYKVVSKQLDNVLIRIRELQYNIPVSSFSQIKAQSEEYASESARLIEMLPQFSTQTLTPQLFQDKLRDRVSAIITKASEAQIIFPANFYLGFDSYRATLPPQNMVSELDRELEIIFILVNQLIDFRIFDISAIYRLSSQDGQISLAKESPMPSQISRPLNQRRVFDLCFISDQKALRGILNFILKCPYLISVEAMQVTSQSSNPPKKDDVNFDNTSMQPLTSQREGSEPQTIKLLFEKEKLMVTLRIAIPILKQTEGGGSVHYSFHFI